MDTNTRTIDGAQVSVTAFVFGHGKGPAVLRDGREGVLFDAGLSRFAMEFRNATVNAEQVGWRIAVEGLLMYPGYTPGHRVTLVVDSHLGNLPRFNDRSMPVCGDFFLPPGFRLLYASADVRSQLCNDLITAADRQAAVLLDLIQAGAADPTQLYEAVDRPYSHFRVWTPEEEPRSVRA